MGVGNEFEELDMKQNMTSKIKKPSDAPPRKEAFDEDSDFLTTNQGLLLSDNHNSLKVGPRGPSLLEDFVLREKITSFDHERIPERVVHARGTGAFGYFECTKDMSEFTSAGLFGALGKKTPVLARFSTVAGSRGSMDTARDVRGFAVKFYTDEGNYDLVGNNIPVFFIQDAMKFPDLVHAVKPEQDLEIPQAQSAHDTFWDFISLMPESLHMVFWTMSDRAIPRSYRMMEGFGVHSFRFVNDAGEGTFVKFHWKPVLGVHSLPWEESQQLGGLDPDYHRRDLAESILNGHLPEWHLGVQLIPESEELKFPFDLLDSTKLVPEELVPVTIIGKMVLNRNPENFFSEIEQAAFHPGHLVPGIDLTNDPLLQGRLFSYTDTQLTRLGGPNFHELPVNRPLAPIANNQRDGFGRQLIPKGKVAYEPNTLKKGCPFHAGADAKAFVHYNEHISAQKVRARSSSFADHISQAKLFFDSQTKVEQSHIGNAFIFELSKVKDPGVRDRMYSLLNFVNSVLAKEIAARVGGKISEKLVLPPNAADPNNNIVPHNYSLEAAMEDDVEGNAKAVLPKASVALGIIVNNPKSAVSRKVALLVTERSDAKSVANLRTALEEAGVMFNFVVPALTIQQDNNDGSKEIEQRLSSTPSHLYDGVFAFTGPEDYAEGGDKGAAVRFVGQAFKHCKTIGGNSNSAKMISQATMGLSDQDAGVILSQSSVLPSDAKAFVDALKEHRHWAREKLAQTLPY